MHPALIVISVMDLGPNKFQLDLLEYIKQYPESEDTQIGGCSTYQCGMSSLTDLCIDKPYAKC